MARTYAERTKKRIQRLIKILNRSGVDDSWTVSFLNSLNSQIERRGKLSHRQDELLNQKEKYYTPETIKKIEAWTKTWQTDSLVREKFAFCARFYEHGRRYYLDVVQQAIDNSKPGIIPTLKKDYKPSHKLYDSITTNKYAQAALTAWEAKPKYPVGSTVVLRENITTAMCWGTAAYSMPKRKDGIPIPYFVLETNASVPKTSTKGSKVYRILRAGAVEPLLIEERALKAIKKSRRAR